MSQAGTDDFHFVNAVLIGNGKSLASAVDDAEYGVSAYLAVSELIDKATPCLGVNPDAVEAACDSGKMARKPHAFFDRRAGGQALDPVSLNDIRTNTTDLTQSLCSGSRLVGCEERFSELGIETLSVVDVRTEAAEGEHNAASDADSFNRSRLGLVERPPFAHLHASHASILFSEDLLQQSAGAKRNAHRFELGGTWNENALTGSLFCHHASG